MLSLKPGWSSILIPGEFIFCNLLLFPWQYFLELHYVLSLNVNAHFLQMPIWDGISHSSMAKTILFGYVIFGVAFDTLAEHILIILTLVTAHVGWAVRKFVLLQWCFAKVFSKLQPNWQRNQVPYTSTKPAKRVIQFEDIVHVDHCFASPHKVCDSCVLPVLNSPKASVMAILSMPPPISLLKRTCQSMRGFELQQKPGSYFS